MNWFSSVGSLVRRLGSNQLVLWISFVLVHLWLGMLNLFGPGLPLGDVTYTYKFWVEQSILNGYTVGIDGGFVYPIVALVPMYLSWIFGPEVYSSTWLSMIMLLNATAFGMLTGWGFRHERLAAAWWWIAFLVLLGPISLGRIDSVTIPLAIIGVTLLAKRPAIAALLLAVATWIKVWPAALLAAIVVATRHRLTAIWMSAAVSVTVIGIALLYGSGGNVFSFFTQQAGRGMQVEAPASTVWLWLAKAGVPDTFVYYDQGILTYQIQGVGTDVASQIMTPLMACVALVVVVAGVFAVWRGASAAHVLPPLALALVTTLIALNKVGSPQFVSWFAVPIVLGLVTSAVGGGIRFRVPAILVLTIGGLTQVIYPYLYPYLLGLDTVMLLAITLRNLLYFVLLAWAIHAIVSLEAVAVEDDEVPDADDSVWPFGALRRAKL